jgi:ribose transport system substrate-binding protein
MRKLGAALAAGAILSVSLAVTIGSASVAQESENQDCVIDYYVMAMEHPLFGIGNVLGAQIAADQVGCELRVVDAQWDVNTQIAQIEAGIAQQPDAMLINAVAAQEPVPAMEAVRDAGIPIVAIDTRPVGFDPETYVAMDMFPGGFLIGQQAAKDMSCAGNYAIIWAVGNEQGAERVRGLKAGMENECSKRGLPNNMVSVSEQSGAGLPLREKAREVTNTLLSQYPEGELDMIFGQTDEWGIGAYLATQAAGRDEVRVYTMDDNPSVRQMIAEGNNLYATTHHRALEVGAAAVQAAVELINGNEVPEEILFSWQLVTQDNIDLDQGWDPENPNAPSYSAHFFPQELVIPLEGNPYNTPEKAADPLGTLDGEE